MEVEGEEKATPAIYPPPLEQETLQYRLATGNIGKNGGQRGSLTRCAQKFGTLQSQMGKKQKTSHPDENGDDNKKDTEENKDSTTNVVETAKQELLKDLGWYQLEWNKLLLVQKNWTKQVQDNTAAQMLRQQQITKLKDEVQKSQIAASKSQNRQNCYMEYEALAKLTNDKHPTTSRNLEKQIQQIQKEITDMEQQQTSIDKTLKVRETQFHLFLQYMFDLKRTLEEPPKDQDDDDKKNGKEEGTTTVGAITLQSPVVLAEKKAKAKQDAEEAAAASEEDSKPAAMDVDGDENEEEEDEDVLYGDL